MRFPRGWWRPLVTYGVVVLAAAAIGGARTPTMFALIVLTGSPLVLFVLARDYLPPARFLRGLRDAGQSVEIVDDELRWFGERRLVARTSSGDWRVECWAGNAIHLRVRGPGMKRIQEVKGSARRAGRAAVDGALPKELLRGPFG